MLRFIIKNHWKDGISTAEGVGYITLDVDVPQLATNSKIRRKRRRFL